MLAKGLALFLILFTTNSFAYLKTSPSSCSSVDLRNEFLGEVRDQGEVEWCYAFTASDLFAYKYHLPRVSAADMAISYNNHTFPRVLKFFIDLWARRRDPERYWMAHQTGFIDIALKRAMKYGVCPETDFSSEHVTKVSLLDGQTLRENVLMKNAQLEIMQLREEILKGNYDLYSLPFYYEFSGINKSDFYDILRYTKRKKVWNSIRQIACNNRIYPDRHSVHYDFKGSLVFKKINRQLDNDNIVAIDYSRQLLLNLDHNNPVASLHTSSIVGRRYNDSTGQCEYLIRDSHGPDCSQYDPRVDCEAGNVWIPENRLYKNMLRMTYIR